MTCVNKMLAGLLVVQLGLAAATWSGRNSEPDEGTRQLLNVALADVTAFEVTESGKDAKAVRLEKKDGAWVVASAGAYPAKASGVEDVLKKVLDIEVGAPLATKKANHNALKVGDRDFDKRVKITAGGKTHELVIGGAKGTSIHVRLAGANEVFWARGVSSWALSSQISSYVDTEYVKVEDPQKVIVENEHGSFTLEKVAGAWTLAGAADPGQVDASKIDSFVRSAATVRMTEPVGTEVTEAHGLGEGAVVTLTGLKEKDGEDEDGEGTKETFTASYVVGSEKDGKFHVKAEDATHVVLVSKWAVEKIKTQKATDFLKSES